MKHFLTLLLSCILGLVLVACTPATDDTVAGDEEPTGDAQYDATSWQEMILPTCTAFFDGCNNCTRGEGSDVAACTRKFCEVYSEPKCLDEEQATDNLDNSAAPAPEDALEVTFECDDDNTFTVTYGAYVTSDAIIQLDADKLVFSDRQTRMATFMTQSADGEGEKYESDDGTMVFWARGEGGSVLKDDQEIYTNCVAFN